MEGPKGPLGPKWPPSPLQELEEGCEAPRTSSRIYFSNSCKVLNTKYLFRHKVIQKLRGKFKHFTKTDR